MARAESEPVPSGSFIALFKMLTAFSLEMEYFIDNNSSNSSSDNGFAETFKIVFMISLCFSNENLCQSAPKHSS